MINKINTIINGFNSKMKDKALNTAYNKLTLDGHSVSILNERYLIVDGSQYQLRASKGMLIAKEF